MKHTEYDLLCGWEDVQGVSIETCEEDALNSRMHVITIPNGQEQLTHLNLIHLSPIIRLIRTIKMC